MLSRKFHVLLLFFTIYLPTFCIGQDYTTHVRHYNVEDGLSDRFVFDIYKDESGFVWFGTQFGLNRFDGYSFKHFSTKDNYLKNNQVNKLQVDGMHNLWLSYSNTKSFTDENGITQYGLYYINLDILNPHTLECINFYDYFEQPPFQLEELFKISNLRKQVLYFLTEDKRLFKYIDTFEEIPFPTILKTKHILQLSQDGTIYTYENGIIKEYDLQGQVLQNFSYTLMNPEQGITLEAFEDGGFMLQSNDFANDTKRFKFFYKKNRTQSLQILDTKNHPSITDNFSFLYSIFHKDGVWVSNFNGDLWHLSETTDSLSNKVVHTFTDKIQIFDQDIKVYKIFQDEINNLWVCTQEGFFILSVKKNPIQQYLKNIRASTRGIVVDKDKKIYVNTYSNSKIIDPVKDEILDLKIAKNPKAAYLGLGLMLDHQGNLWSGSHMRYIFKYNIETKEQKEYPVLGSDNLSVYESANHTMWSLSGNDGLYYLDTELDSFVLYNHLNEFKDFHKHGFRHIAPTRDTKGLWLSSEKGLYRLDFKNGVQAYYAIENQRLIHDYINYCYEDKEGILWLATKGYGLIKWDIKQDKWEQFTTQEGLSHNVIYSIHEDKHNRLWIPSNYGLMCFDKATNSVNTLHIGDGISHEEFNALSHYEHPDGTLYLGGINGMMVFNPNEYEIDFNDKFPLEIIDFDKTNQNNGEVTSLLTAFKNQEKIELHDKERNVYLKFALLDFDNIYQHRYAYQLEGIDKDWQYLKENFIRFNQLPHGDYTLKIKGQSANGKWSTNEISIPLLVKKPFYLRWWFFLLCFIILADLIYFWLKMRTRRFRKEKEKLEAVVAERTEQIQKDKEIISVQADKLKELNETKSRFFRNISHELRTPLTLILGQVQNITTQKKWTPNTDYQLEVIERNSKKMLLLTEELLDLTRLDINKLELHEKAIAFEPFIRQIVAGFESTAKLKKVKLSWDFDIDKTAWIEVDDKKLETILYNLLSNAIKFTPTQKAVHLVVKQKQDDLIIQVINDGKGIHPEDLPHIFERFYQSKKNKVNQAGGIGIGLALSKELSEIMNAELSVESNPNEKTTFTVQFPYKIASPNTDTIPQVAIAANNEIEINTNGQTITNQPSLLLVEDNNDMLIYIKNLLSPNFNIYTAMNGLEAKQLLEANQKTIDLIVSDVMMPEMDGFALLDYIRHTAQWSQTPIILLTALSDKKHKLNALNMGVNDYITKPFEKEELTASIANLLNLQTVRQTVNQVDKNQTDNPLNVTTSQEQTQSHDEKWLEEVELIVDKHFHKKDFGVTQLATHLLISPRQLNRKLKKATGFTPNHFIREIRLQNARLLLESQQFATVAEVCYKVGFATPDYFARIYKERFGKLPSDVFNPSN